MKLHDNDLWKAFSQTVEKIEKKNIAFKASDIKAPLLNKKQNNLIRMQLEISSGASKRPTLETSVMSKLEKRKFFEEARIDIHGCTREMVGQKLAAFCCRCLMINIRNVVIITGKGEGIIRQATYDWMMDSPEYVINFFPINDSCGQSGAFAVRLRKP